jgi:hypothetical protein
MARIPPEELERLKAEVSVEHLVAASGVDLKAAGKDLLGRCPFHEDREASLVVTPGKNLWHCFSCQIGGGPIDVARTVQSGPNNNQLNNYDEGSGLLQSPLVPLLPGFIDNAWQQANDAAYKACSCGH